MKIYTKTGDKGSTSLIGGKRVPKDDLRLEAYGTVDELNCFLGLLSDSPGVKEGLKKELKDIQNSLFNLGGQLASLPEDIEKYHVPVITEDEIGTLEKAIDRMQESLPPLEKFILPGGHPAVSLAHVSRSICRRAERRTVTLKGAGTAGLDTAEKYLNRLSDYLFVTARTIAQDCGIEERVWEYPGSSK